MSETTNRRPWQELTPLADWLVNALAPACAEVVIAGSYRRRSQAVGDLEVVALPKWETPPPELDIFGDVVSQPQDEYPLLEETIFELLDRGHFIQARVNGRLMKSFTIGMVIGFGMQPTDYFAGQKIDLFIATETNFGNILTIRTGPREFSRRIVTPRDKGGRNMPAGIYQADGVLKSYGIVVPCRTEREFFAAIGLAYVEPEERI